MNDCRGSLLERIRQTTASPADRLAFDAHLAACESCRLSWEFGAAFDRVGVAKNDGATIARLAARTLESGATLETGASRLFASLGRTRRRTMRPVILAALGFSSVAMAGALTWSFTERSPSVPADSHTATIPPTTGRAAALEVARDAPPQPTAAPPPPFGAEEARLPSSGEAPEGRAQPAPSPVAPSASALFKAANDARRTGQAALAVKRYRDLQRQFPTSGESALSRVSLGGLLLEQGKAAAALEQFDLYLRASANKPLIAEALYGRGRALGTLGRRQQEVKNWQQLLSAYPDSPYSGAARRRLAALRAR